MTFRGEDKIEHGEEEWVKGYFIGIITSVNVFIIIYLIT